MRMFRLLLPISLLCGIAAAQQVNPITNIRWGAAPGCASVGFVYAPANQGCIQTSAAGFAWGSTVSSPQNSTDTVLTISAIPSGLPSAGTFFVANEYESYTGIDVGASQLTGITRGVALTTPASHNPGENVVSVNIPFSPFSQTPRGGVFGAGGGGGGAMVLAINCGTPVEPNDAGALAVFQANCGNSATWIDSAGRIHQNAVQGIFNFLSPIYIAPNLPSDIGTGGSYPLPITNTTNVAQTNGQYQFGSAIGFTSGIYGPVQALPVPNIPAPTLTGELGGSCSITYEVAGVDADGNGVPGTPVTVSGLAEFISGVQGLVYIQAPQVAGIVTYDVYRTAISGACGIVTTTGKFTTSATTLYPWFQDTGNAGDSTTPPGSNTSIAKSCIGTAANHELFCRLAGPSGTPSVACSSSTLSWDWVNTSATSTPFELKCNGTSWVTAF